jgi:hypothetical protein
MSKFIYSFLIITLFIELTGCSTVTVRTDAAQSITDPARPIEATVHRLFWGYFPIGGDYIARDCTSKSLQSVNFHSNWWEAIVTIATAGIYCPVEVNYLCAKEPLPQLSGNSIRIQNIYSGSDTLVTLYSSYLNQDKNYWKWQAWLTNSKQQAKKSFVILAEKDTLNYLLANLKNQFTYTIDFINKADTTLHVKKQIN